MRSGSCARRDRGCPKPGGRFGTNSGVPMSDRTGERIRTCPMHPEVRERDAARCRASRPNLMGGIDARVGSGLDQSPVSRVPKGSSHAISPRCRANPAPLSVLGISVTDRNGESRSPRESRPMSETCVVWLTPNRGFKAWSPQPPNCRDFDSSGPSGTDYAAQARIELQDCGSRKQIGAASS